MDILSTVIEKVSIYRSGAEIVRRGSLELSEGKHKLYVSGMSGSVSYDTVRLFGSEGIRVSNQRFEAFGDHEEDKESDKIRRSIDDLERQIEIRQMQIDMWRSNGDFTSRTVQSASEVEEYIEKLPQRIEKLNEMIAECRRQQEVLTEKLQEAEKKEAAPAAVVDVDVEKGGTYSFELRYFESNAEWRPVYELYSDGEGPLEIRMRAKITQSTGEDWENVQVTLFTGNPSSGNVLPEPDTVYLDFRTEIQPRAFGAMAKNAQLMGMAMDTAVADEEATGTNGFMEESLGRLQTSQADVSDDETMTEYALPGKKDILDNDDGMMADLQSYEIPAEYEVAAVPALDPRAYLTAKVKTADIPFTSSFSAGVFLKEKYLCSVYLDPDLTKDEIIITLGEDERIKISRKEVSRKASNTFLRGQRTVEHVFETRVTNTSGKDADVLIRDQIPVSREKDITVEIKDLSGMKHDEKTGEVSGTVRIPAGQTSVSSLAYKVSWPKDKKITETRSNPGTRYCPSCGARVYGRFCPECGSLVD